MQDYLKITYSSSVERLCEINKSFDSGIMKIAYTGKNRNGSSISKEAFERSKHTIYNCPVVCNYDRELDQIGSHDIEFVSKDGHIKMVNLTQPVGVVPESANMWWEVFEDSTGTHEYLCVEVLIWKRQEAYEKIKENIITDQSMEIRVKDGRMEDGIYVIDSFEFLAFCLLESAQPCYESASLEMFTLEEFHNKYSEMMEELKQSYTTVIPSSEGGIDTILTEGGKKQLEQKLELLASFGLSVDTIDFEIDTMTYEELEDKLKKRADDDDDDQADTDPEGGSETGDDESGDETPEDTDDESHDDAEEQFSLSGEQFRQILIEALESIRIETSWGEMPRYWYMDYDPEESEVYCTDNEDYKMYGFKYAMNGDNVVIDFETKKRKKISIVDFDEGEEAFSMKEMFDAVANASAAHKESEMNAQFESVRSELEAKYNDAFDTLSSVNAELKELREYKQTKMSAERDSQVAEVFARFAELKDVEAFKELQSNCSDMTIEELEEKCFALKGRYGMRTFATTHSSTPRLPIDRSNHNDEPYGGLFVKYPPKGYN